MCQDSRSQLKNKQSCIKNLREKIKLLNYIPPIRVKTKKPKSAKIKILDEKKKHSIKKKMRKKPGLED